MSTELTKYNIWSYICYRIPPSVVTLKFSHGSVINFFCKFSKKCFVISSYTFLNFSKIFNFSTFFGDFEKFWKIQKKCVTRSRNLFVKIYKKFDDRQTYMAYVIYATSRRIKKLISRFLIWLLLNWLIYNLQMLPWYRKQTSWVWAGQAQP